LKFNIGSDDVILSHESIVSDGQYHFCVLRRDWMNATMRVDGGSEISVGQSGKNITWYMLIYLLIPPPGESEVTILVFESSCHLLVTTSLTTQK